MHTRLTAIVTLTVLGFGTLALAGSAAASSSNSVAYMSAKQLQRTCKTGGGTFGTARSHYYCVLGSKAIMCDSSTHQCAWATTTASSSSDDNAGPDYPPASLSDGLLVPDVPVFTPPPAPEPIGPVERGHGPRIH
jgi:hypothetical protein